MPVPGFSEHGLLPEGVHDCSIEEIAQALCGTDQRALIFQRLIAFLEWTRTLPGPVSVYIDGSFVTDKATPGDVDVIVDIGSCDELGQAIWIREFMSNHDRIKEHYSVDFYPQIPNHGHDFRRFFQYVRIDDAMARGAHPETRKGILRLAA